MADNTDEKDLDGYIADLVKKGGTRQLFDLYETYLGNEELEDKFGDAIAQSLNYAKRQSTRYLEHLIAHLDKGNGSDKLFDPHGISSIIRKIEPSRIRSFVLSKLRRERLGEDDTMQLAVLTLVPGIDERLIKRILRHNSFKIFNFGDIAALIFRQDLSESLRIEAVKVCCGDEDWRGEYFKLLLTGDKKLPEPLLIASIKLFGRSGMIEELVILLEKECYQNKKQEIISAIVEAMQVCKMEQLMSLLDKKESLPPGIKEKIEPSIDELVTSLEVKKLDEKLYQEGYYDLSSICESLISVLCREEISEKIREKAERALLKNIKLLARYLEVQSICGLLEEKNLPKNIRTAVELQIMEALKRVITMMKKNREITYKLDLMLYDNYLPPRVRIEVLKVLDKEDFGRQFGIVLSLLNEPELQEDLRRAAEHRILLWVRICKDKDQAAALFALLCKDNIPEHLIAAAAEKILEVGEAGKLAGMVKDAREGREPGLPDFLERRIGMALEKHVGFHQKFLDIVEKLIKKDPVFNIFVRIEERVGSSNDPPELGRRLSQPRSGQTTKALQIARIVS